MKRFDALVAIVLLFISSLAIAQEPQPQRREGPAAMLALIVTDSKGRHVPSLSKDDVQLAIGGVPVDLVKFAERGVGGAPAGEMRRIAVLFDVSSLSMGARRQAAEALHGFLSSNLRPGDFVVILAGGPSLRAMTPWTSKLEVIDAALERVSGESSPSAFASVSTRSSYSVIRANPAGAKSRPTGCTVVFSVQITFCARL